MRHQSTVRSSRSLHCQILMVAAAALVWAGTAIAQEVPDRYDWPQPTQSARPWTRWWWHGSAVELDEISRLLQVYHDAGLGGVEITCIYGVKGNEENNREYLSDAWVEAVSHTLREAQALGMGVDLPAGSGWRMGGPSVEMDQANSSLVLDKAEVAGGANVTLRFNRRTTPQRVVAYDADGNQTDLTDQLNERELTWAAPPGNWTVYLAGYRWSGDRVKRPGPGGAGLNINPLSKSSVESFLTFFGRTLDKLPDGIRGQFHDSFEYEGDWQPQFFEEFATRRGYRLEEHLRELAGDGDPDDVARVKCDYRETVSDLVLEGLVQPWIDWAHSHNQLARNQSHGSPANWLDLYAACDIPETESFGRLSGPDAHLYMFKFASSAAHVAGRPLVSSETATWLDEHFTVTLAQVKEIIDRQMLAGVNHVFYHGTAYSPTDAAWPGWLFYASTQLNPQNPIWRDFPILNEYVTRAQSLLQAARPDSSVLLYWPIHDAWHNPRGLRKNIRVHNGRDWIYGWPLEEAANQLRDAGVAFDFLSDRLLSRCQAKDGKIAAPGGRYEAVVVPAARHMPLATLEKLAELAEAGVPVIFWRDVPQSASGIVTQETAARWHDVVGRIKAMNEGQAATTTDGQRGDDLIAMLTDAGVRAETWATEHHLAFLRKSLDGDPLYLVYNTSDEPFDGTVQPTTAGAAAVIMDAMTGDIGRVQLRDGAMRLQIPPRHSLFVRFIDATPDDLPEWQYLKPAGEPVVVAGPWKLEFIFGGPELPAPRDLDRPQPWTDLEDSDAERFAGTARYSTTLVVPEESSAWHLDLGEVTGSARVRIGDEQVGVLLSAPYRLTLPKLAAGEHRLEIEVTGVAANRIRDLDRRGVEWRIFEDINLVNIDYRPFDASDWPVRPQGLAGPVTLQAQVIEQ